MFTGTCTLLVDVANTLQTDQHWNVSFYGCVHCSWEQSVEMTIYGLPVLVYITILIKVNST